MLNKITFSIGGENDKNIKKIYSVTFNSDNY